MRRAARVLRADCLHCCPPRGTPTPGGPLRTGLLLDELVPQFSSYPMLLMDSAHRHTEQSMTVAFVRSTYVSPTVAMKDTLPVAPKFTETKNWPEESAVAW